jgi:ABC-2 type transport system ATP-binding protein
LVSLLRAVGLLGQTDQPIETLSTGETTRLGIAASLVADPPLLVWDEPTAGLDPAARRFTLDLIRELGKNHTIIVSTHILSDIDQVCDHVGVMHEGRMIFSGAMQDMKRRLRRDDFSLEVGGSEADIQRLVGQMNGIDGVNVEVRAANTLMVRIAQERSQAAALAELLKMVDAAGLPLAAIHSNLHETENAYLQLLQEDQSHGFQRFDLNTRRADAPLSGDLPA